MSDKVLVIKNISDEDINKIVMMVSPMGYEGETTCDVFDSVDHAHTKDVILTRLSNDDRFNNLCNHCKIQLADEILDQLGTTDTWDHDALDNYMEYIDLSNNSIYKMCIVNNRPGNKYINGTRGTASNITFPDIDVPNINALDMDMVINDIKSNTPYHKRWTNQLNRIDGVQSEIEYEFNDLIQCILSSKASGRPLREHLKEAGLFNQLLTYDIDGNDTSNIYGDIILSAQLKCRDELLASMHVEDDRPYLERIHRDNVFSDEFTNLFQTLSLPAIKKEDIKSMVFKEDKKMMMDFLEDDDKLSDFGKRIHGDELVTYEEGNE